jgi:nucleoside-diphosphate-sugar epimerase
MRVLVTGGTGVVGRPSVGRLLESGHTVRLLSRNAAHDAASWPEGVEAHPASVDDRESVRAAADGCDAVLHIAGIMAEDPPEVTFQRVNVEGTLHLLADSLPERLIEEGTGALRRHRFWADIRGSRMSAEEVIRHRERTE